MLAGEGGCRKTAAVKRAQKLCPFRGGCSTTPRRRNGLAHGARVYHVPRRADRRPLLYRLRMTTIVSDLERKGARDLTVTRVEAIGGLADAEDDGIRLFRKYSEKYSGR